MFRFVLMLFMVVFVGAGVLSLVSPELVGDLIFLVLGIVVAAAVLKIALDLFLHWKKEEVDDENLRHLTKEPKGEVYFDIKKYSQELEKRDKQQ